MLGTSDSQVLWVRNLDLDSKEEGSKNASTDMFGLRYGLQFQSSEFDKNGLPPEIVRHEVGTFPPACAKANIGCSPTNVKPGL